MKVFPNVVIALLAFGTGLGISAAYRAYSNFQPEGRALNCIAHGSICVGMNAKQAIFLAEGSLGGLTNVGCGFDELQGSLKEEMILSDVIQRGCSSPRYVAVFSDGRYLTGIWIKNNKVFRLDRNPAHEVDF
ncbi:MAG TPA: hypothetical protein VGH02_14720 [Rhizomicrobium sp.]|jgi:hypothetical protein